MLHTDLQTLADWIRQADIITPQQQNQIADILDDTSKQAKEMTNHTVRQTKRPIATASKVIPFPKTHKPDGVA